jgi:hypothetical protein
VRSADKFPCLSPSERFHLISNAHFQANFRKILMGKSLNEQ